MSGLERLKAEVRRRRPELVAGGLTLLRYYLEAGRPDQVQDIGSFESWCALIPSALVHLGLGNATTSMRQAGSEDIERGDLGAVLATWHQEFGDVDVSAKAAVDRADPATPLLDPATLAFQEALRAIAVDRRTGRISTKRLGRWLLSHKGTIVNGHRFVCEHDRTNMKIWRAQRV